MAQQLVPKVSDQSELLRPQLIIPRADIESAPTACARARNARPCIVHSVYSSG